MRLYPKFVLDLSDRRTYQSPEDRAKRLGGWTKAVAGASAVAFATFLATMGLLGSRPTDGRTAFTMALAALIAALLANAAIWRSAYLEPDTEHRIREDARFLGITRVATNHWEIAGAVWGYWVFAALLYVVAIWLAFNAAWVAFGEQPA